MSKHPVVHVELSALSRKEAADFYHQVFGWEIEHMDEMRYTTFSTGEGEIGGGFNDAGENYPAGTSMIYIGTEDIDATLAAVEALGGEAVTPKSEIPGFGWYAHFRDPTGNLLGLYTVLAGAGAG